MIPPKLIDFIKRAEGLSLRAYPDAGGWAIGYGHNSPAIHSGMEITQAQADEFLEQDLGTVMKEINAVGVPLGPNQIVALGSFIFNVGTGAFRTSTMCRLLKSGDYSGAAAQFPRWNKSQGLPNTNLTARRALEQELFLRDEPV
jgi:lysozyme